MTSISDNFLVVQLATDPSVIGHYPAVLPHEHINHGEPTRLYKVKPTELAQFDLNYEIDLHPKAYATDFLLDDSITLGWVVSARMKEILCTMSLPLHSFYPIKVHHRGSVMDYHIFHFIFDMWEYLVPEKSVFQIRNKYSRQTLETGHPESKMDFQKRMKSLSADQTMRWVKICFTPDILNQDVISFGAQQLHFAASKRLLQTMSDHEITGYESISTNILNIEDR